MAIFRSLILQNTMSSGCEASDENCPKRGICEYFSDEHPLPKINTGLLGTVVCFEDGSYWKLTTALSDMRYQQKAPPYEAIQAFQCVCLRDLNNDYEGIEEAVIKVKFQYEIACRGHSVHLLTLYR